MTKKQLLKEIDHWRTEGLVSDESSDILKKRYAGGSKGTLAIIFSVAGSALIAAGIVLLFAKNWYSLPLYVKAILSFLPLLLGQALAVFTLAKKSDSLPWREGSAIFLTGTLFAAFSLTNQSFNLNFSFYEYMLSCTVLTLPIIYTLDAVSPLAVYFGTALAFGLNNSDCFNSFIILTLLMIAGLIYVIIHRGDNHPRRTLAAWISAISGGFYVFFLLDSVLESDINIVPVFAAYFLILYSASSPESGLSYPSKSLGAIGASTCTVISVITSSLTYVPFEQYATFDEYFALFFTLAALIAAIITAIKKKRRDICALIFVILCCAVSAICMIVPAFSQSQAAILAACVLALGAGVCFTVKGAEESEMSTSNLGLVLICAVIVMCFFRLDTDLLVKGIAFLVLGVMFLSANILMLKHKKQALNN